MKLFKDLTPEEQSLAIELEKQNLLLSLASRTVFAQDPLLQKYVDQAIAWGVRRRTPDLIPNYIYHLAKLAIDNMVGDMVMSNLYAEPEEVVIHNVVGCAPNLKNLH